MVERHAGRTVRRSVHHRSMGQKITVGMDIHPGNIVPHLSAEQAVQMQGPHFCHTPRNHELAAHPVFEFHFALKNKHACAAFRQTFGQRRSSQSTAYNNQVVTFGHKSTSPHVISCAKYISSFFLWTHSVQSESG